MTIALLHRAGVECTGSYGAALAQSLSRERIQVVEVNQPDRRAAVTPKTGKGPAADLRVLRLAKESAVKARQSTANATSSASFAARSLQPGRSEEGVSCQGASSLITVQPVGCRPQLPPLIVRRTRCQAVSSAAHATSRACAAIARANCRRQCFP
ncbi:hypothetical protein ACFW93_41760 [Streptomyces canus]|uniref:hypothetical protein n=1 Tax=Streptomyces canus TaxID=58343 RepID=UPI0036AFC502